jgi:hypothetical protein
VKGFLKMKTYTLILFITIITASACGPVTPIATIAKTLEISRNGKTYEVQLVQNFDNTNPNQGSVKITIQWAGNLDQDIEIEYIVEIKFCEAYCYNKIELIDYSSEKDEYQVLDSTERYFSVVYDDLDNDNNPEIITRDYDFHFAVGGIERLTRGLAPIKILHYDYTQIEFTTVTNQFPDLVEKDADYFIKHVPTDYPGGVGGFELASYLYDMYILGKQNEGIRQFNETCLKYLQPEMTDPNWCKNYLLKTKTALKQRGIGVE